MAICFVVGGVLIFAIAPMFIRGVDVIRPVLDAKGQQVYRADGRPKFEGDPIAQFMINWDAYAVIAVGGLCILYGVGSAWRNRTTAAPDRKPKDQA